jgi:hypothetical protein
MGGEEKESLAGSAVGAYVTRDTRGARPMYEGEWTLIAPRKPSSASGGFTDSNGVSVRRIPLQKWLFTSDLSAGLIRVSNCSVAYLKGARLERHSTIDSCRRETEERADGLIIRPEGRSAVIPIQSSFIREEKSCIASKLVAGQEIISRIRMPRSQAGLDDPIATPVKLVKDLPDLTGDTSAPNRSVGCRRHRQGL